jgi:putative Ca2+/H+ antiporter (TMEM165/GDT1 family)
MFTTTLSTFALIFLAEIGDKSQLVCVLLASRHRGIPVFLGASVAFMLLNILAVTVGAAASQAVPEWVLAILVALLFAFFGVKALLEQGDNGEQVDELPGHGVFVVAFLMIFVAEFGDKTQLTVAALGAAANPIAVYIGATTALITTTLFGVLGGKWLTQRVSAVTLHRIGGIFFLAFAVWVMYDTFL